MQELQQGDAIMREGAHKGTRHDAKGPLGLLPPHLLMVFAIISVQFGAALATRLFAVLGPTGTVFFRLGFSALLLVIIYRPKITGEIRQHLSEICVLGVAISMMNLSYYHAIARIPLGVAVAIEFIGPLLVGAATSRRPSDFLWLAMAAAGVAFFARDIGTSLDPAGVAFALAAAAGWAGFIIASKRVGNRVAGGQGLALALVVGTVAVLPIYVVGSDVSRAFAFLPLAGAFIVAMLSTALPMSLEYAALQRLPAHVYSVIVTLEPVVATAIGLVLLGQPLNLAMGAGIVLISLASLGVTLFNR